MTLRAAEGKMERNFCGLRIRQLRPPGIRTEFAFRWGTRFFFWLGEEEIREFMESHQYLAVHKERRKAALGKIRGYRK